LTVASVSPNIAAARNADNRHPANDISSIGMLISPVNAPFGSNKRFGGKD